jgi:hypothetical protein
LIKVVLFGTLSSISPEEILVGEMEIFMQRSIFAVLATVFSVLALTSSSAFSGNYPFGDEPYRLNWWGYDPGVQSGCLRWNWQQYGWDDFCPLYAYPKAYMFYPRAPRVVLRRKG